MSIDWTTLNNKASDFHILNVNRDTQNNVADALFSGLYVKLSDIVSGFQAGGAPLVSVFADTLVIDVPSFNALGSVVFARNIDVSPLKGVPVRVGVPPQGQTAVAEFLVKGTTGGPLQLSPSAGAAAPFTVPTGDNPLQDVYYFLDPAGTPTQQVKTDPGYVQDLLGRMWTLNSLKASFAAAAWLMDSNQAADRATAQSMLGWIVSCVQALAAGGNAVPSDFAELYSQAAALLVTLNVAPGAIYVPVLSSKFYEQQVNTFLGALQSYEDNLNTLNVQTNIEQAIRQVSATLQSVSQAEAAPLQTQLDIINQNINSLSDDIKSLQYQFFLQQFDSQGRFAVLKLKIAEQQVEQFLEACFKLVTDLIGAGASAASALAGNVAGAAEAAKSTAKSVKALADLIKAGGELIKNGDTIYKDASSAIKKAGAGGGSKGSDLPAKAQELMDMQQQLMASFQAAGEMWARAQLDPGSTPDLSTSRLSAVSVDPALAWDNYMASATATLTTIKESIGSGTGSGPAQEAANQYLASLTMLSNYGKAIAAKFSAFTAQTAQGTVVLAQIRAAKNVQARWEQLQKEAKTDEERLAALRGAIQSRADAIRRSIYVAWTNYRNSYYYLYFKEPPVAVSLDMNTAQLKDAFATVSQWVARLLGDDPSGKQVRLPEDNVSISFRFNIISSKDEYQPGVDSALLTPDDIRNKAALTWVIPIGDSQLKEVLPDAGNVAIWIKEAKFFVEGIRPNSKGNVIATISTSGTYQNGFGARAAHNFVSKGLVGDFGYNAQGQSVYIPWKIDTEVYATPTPYTQWTMVFDRSGGEGEFTGGDPVGAKTLRMDLTVAYRRKS